MQEHDPAFDVELMARVAKGDKEALCSLMQRWEAPLGGFIYRYVQNREATSELVQETFVRLYEARARFRTDMRFSSWLFRIAANLCRNYHRWRCRHPEDMAWDEACEAVNAPAPGVSRDEDDPACAAERVEDIRRLKDAISDMPHDLRTALLLHYYEDMSYRDIAQTVGCSERGVETRLYRAKAWLAKAFGRNGGTEHPDCGAIAAGGLL